jgi:hypothetical protein
MNSLKKVLFLVLFALSTSSSFSQISETSEYIPLEEINNERQTDNNIKRDLELLSILPVVQYDTEAESIIIESLHVSFTSVTYCITDENDAVLTGNEIDLPRNCEHDIPLSHLPQGTYYIVLEIDGIRFTGEFEKF